MNKFIIFFLFQKLKTEFYFPGTNLLILYILKDENPYLAKD